MRAGREGEANILFSLAEKKTIANSGVLYLSSLSPLYCEPWSLVQCLSHGHSSYYWALSTRCLANYSSFSCLNVTPYSAFAIVKPRVYCKWMFCWEELFIFFFSQRLPWLLVPLLSVCFQFLTEQTHLQAEMSFLTMSMKWISFQIAPVITSICRGNFSLRLIRSVDKNNIMTQRGPVKHLLFQKANIEFPALYLQ